MKRILIWAAVLLLLTACAGLAEDNLLQNGDFLAVREDESPEFWQRVLVKDAMANASVCLDDDGTYCAYLLAKNPAAIRFEQTVDVRPNALYKLSVSAQVTLEEGDGASIRVGESIEAFPLAGGTQGQWTQLTAYGRAGENQQTATVQLTLGSADAPARGTVLFKNAVFTEVSALPAGERALNLSGSAKDDAQASEDDTQAAEEAVPLRRTEALLFCGIAALLLCAFAYRRRFALPESGFQLRPWLLLLLGLAAGLRVMLSFAVQTPCLERTWLTQSAEALASLGPRAVDGAVLGDSPAYALLLLLPTYLGDLFGVSLGSQAQLFCLKLVPIAADLLLGLLIAREAERAMHGRAALLFSAFFLLTPAAAVCSGVLGQSTALAALLLALSLLQLKNGRIRTALPAFAFAALLIPEWLIALSLALLIILYIAMTRPFDQKKAVQLAQGLGLSLALIYLFGLCYSLGEPFRALLPFEAAMQRMRAFYSARGVLSLDAFGLYTLLGYNGAPFSSAEWLMIIGLVLSAGALCLCGAALVKRRERFFLAAGALCAVLACAAPMSGPFAPLLSLSLLVFAAIETRDARILPSAALGALLLFLNVMLYAQGGESSAFYEHLQGSEQGLNLVLSALSLVNAGCLLYILLTPARASAFSVQPPARTEDELPQPGRFHLHLKPKDFLIMAVIALVYAVPAFVNLGDTTGPQTQWRAERDGETVVFDLDEKKDFYIVYNPGGCNTNFAVELSDDGESWTPPYYAPATNKNVFHWIYYTPYTQENEYLVLKSGDHTYKGVRFPSDEERYPHQTARYVRLTAGKKTLMLNELGFLDMEKKAFTPAVMSADGSCEGTNDPTRLIDEPDTVPDTPTYMNSMYFDEVYHARTAYEYIEGLKAYEWTHPPLGRVIMGIGIRLFGMTPFGWRFMGTLIGVLMLPVMYLLMMQLTHKRKYALIATLLLALDGMHFVQTRIATVDSYPVFFIMLAVLFMIRYLQVDTRRDGLKRALTALGLCGLNMGLACASKWIGVYCGIGLAVMFFYSLAARCLRARCDPAAYPAFKKDTLITLAACVGFFVIVPLAVYYFSYYWHMQPSGGLSIKAVAKLQGQILSYHSGSTGMGHIYVSSWYQWPTIVWPMAFYSLGAFSPEGVISRIVCMGNPVIWWCGLAAVVFLVLRACFLKRADKKELVVLTAYFAQLCPWLLITRGTFIYHYFACVPFLIATLPLALSHITARFPRVGRIAPWVLVGLSAIAFAAFFPLFYGLPIPEGYASLLRWFGWKAF